MKKVFILLGLCGISFFLISWGYSGHSTIGRKCTESFPVTMSCFLPWADSIANHSSDADTRKGWDPSESMRHYIDIDNYSEFVATGRIPSTYDSVVEIHGLEFVEQEGILPWATINKYDSIKMSFQLHDWESALRQIYDLSHYVGDGHMPLHITRNFNGNFTEQTGVHSRYESSMVGYNIDALDNYSSDSVHFISDVNKYVFNYLYHNYLYIDSILNADTYAQNLAGNTNSALYYQTLFSKTKDFTTLLLHNASLALADLIYTAWIEAGSPQFTTSISSNSLPDKLQMDIYPNPVSAFAVFSVSSLQTGETFLKISDLNGKQVLAEKINLNPGKTSFHISLNGLRNGVYIATLSQQGKTAYLRFVIKR